MSETVANIELPEIKESEKGNKLTPFNIELVKDVETQVEVKLGSASISLGELFDLKENSVLTIDKALDEPVSIFFKGQELARGELVAVGDHFGVKVVQVAK